MIARRWITHYRSYLPFVASLVVLAVVWETVGQHTELLTLPPLSAVFKAFAALWTDGVMKAPLADSTIALVIGLGISLTAGTILGIGMGLFRVVDVALGPYVKAGLSAPLIAFVPVFLMLFGIGSTTRIATVVAFSVWIIAINTATAVRSAESALIEMGKTFGAGRWRLFWEIQLPAGAPYLMAGLQLGVARGVKGLINGEVLIAIVGLGGLIKQYGTVFSMDQLYAVILLVIAYAVIAVGLVSGVGRLVFRNHETVSTWRTR